MTTNGAEPATPQPVQDLAGYEVIVALTGGIAAYKVCTVISRIEIKDYIDLYFLGRAGYPLENYIAMAQQKDAGVSQATVAFVLSEVRLLKVPDFMISPVSLVDLQEYFHSLARKLAVESFPR